MAAYWAPWDSLGKNTRVGCHFLLQCMKVKSQSEVVSRVLLLAIPWTAAHQAPPSMGFSRQEYWSGVPSPSPRLLLVFYKFFEGKIWFHCEPQDYGTFYMSFKFSVQEVLSFYET